MNNLTSQILLLFVGLFRYTNFMIFITLYGLNINYVLYFPTKVIKLMEILHKRTLPGKVQGRKKFLKIPFYELSAFIRVKSKN